MLRTPPSDDDSIDKSRPPANSPKASPPTMHVHHQETSHQAAESFPRQPCEPKPQRKVVYVKNSPSDDEMADDTHPAMNSPTASPPAK